MPISGNEDGWCENSKMVWIRKKVEKVGKIHELMVPNFIFFYREIWITIKTWMGPILISGQKRPFAVCRQGV